MKSLLAVLTGLCVAFAQMSLSSGVATLWVQRLGWTLLHSVWQISLLAVVAAITLRLLKNQSAATRYAAAVTCFVLLAIAPFVTWTVLKTPDVAEFAATDLEDPVDYSPSVVVNSVDVISTLGLKPRSPAQSALPIGTEDAMGPVEDAAGGYLATRDAAEEKAFALAKAVSDASHRMVSATDATDKGQTRDSTTLVNAVVASITRRTSLIVRLWVLGILVCSVRPISSLWALRRLRRRGLTPAPGSIESAVIRLSKRLGLSKTVGVFESSLINVPMVVGYLRPVILLPGAVVTGLSTNQLEAVLIHELAHVRRHDWLLNSLQVLVETLLFYHPAVWWLSKRIRQERELCCDDIALKQDVDKAVYARMLLLLEELRRTPATPALAATGGDLAQRIRRLLPDEPTQKPTRRPGGGLAVAVLLLSLFTAVSSAALLNVSSQTGGKNLLEQQSDDNGADRQVSDSHDPRIVQGLVLAVNGKPAAGVTVQLGSNRRTLNERPLLVSRTDERGQYRFVLPDDPVNLRARVYVIPESAAAVSRAVSGKTVNQPEFRLKRGTRLMGRVLDAAGNGIPNVVVQADGGERIPMRFALTGTDGSYTTQPCQYGDYEIRLLDGETAPVKGIPGRRLSAAFARIHTSISKTAGTTQSVEVHRAAQSSSVRVQLKIADEVLKERRNVTSTPPGQLALIGRINGLKWNECFRKLEDQPDSYELIVPSAIRGRIYWRHPGGWESSQFKITGPSLTNLQFDGDTQHKATLTHSPQRTSFPDRTVRLKEKAASDEGPAPNEQLMRSIQVLDEDEKPIVGAEVRLQFQHSGDSIFNIDAMHSTKTDAEGRVKLEAPADSQSVHVSIKADGFGEFSEQQQPTGSSTITLKRGRVIHVRAVNEAGQVLDKAVPLLQNHRIWGREFAVQDDGTFKSPAVDMKRRLMRVVTAQQDGPLLFSELLDVESLETGNDGIAEVTLKPGTKLTGRLDDSVPRPITEGYVDLMVVEGLDHTLSTSHSRFQTGAWAWEDSAPVRPDGTFTFESVPSGGVAQVHVVVDGYMSINPPVEELADIIVTHANGDDTTLEGLQDHVSSRSMWPYLVPVKQPTADIVIACQETASCDFRILDPAGNPISDASVSFSPNGIFINGSLFIPGSNTFQNASLVHQLFHGQPAFAALNGQAKTPRDIAIAKQREWAARSFVGAKSDADGRVKIRNLPGGTREGFRVNAAGFVLPRSPLYPDFDDRREGYIDLVAGETAEATIYLERDQPVVDREILVVDDQGRPLPQATVALVQMRVGSKDWQMWSSQRFGSLQSAVTDEEGRVVLSVPSSIEEKAVEQLRLAVNYREKQRRRPVGEKHNRLWLNGAMVDLPLKEDGGVVAAVHGAVESRPDRAAYGKLSDILHGIDSKQLLEKMIERPGLAILRQLLSASDKPYPQPVELLDEGRFGSNEKGVKVHLIPTTTSTFSLVSAKVRPMNGTRSEETEMSRLPECVFVFDADGQHVASIGGEIGTTGAGSPDDVDIICLGPAEDWFVRTTRFQKNGAFEFQSKYFRIDDSVVGSLKYFHYANSNSWSMGPEKVPRYGSLDFDFPVRTQKYAGSVVGLSPDNVAMNATIIWDADRNQFFGAVSQTIDGRPLFKVDTDWSKEFQPLTPKHNQMVLAGGAREYDHWYGWQTVVPEGFEVIVRVTVPQAKGEARTLEQKLTAGRYMIQFQAKPNKDGQSFSLQLGYGKDQEIQKADLLLGATDQPAAAVAVVNTISSGESVRLVDRPLRNSSSLTLDVLLNPLAE